MEKKEKSELPAKLLLLRSLAGLNLQPEMRADAIGPRR
jgi:hypothetical protein